MPATFGIGDISIACKARSYDKRLSRHSGMTTQIKSSAPFVLLWQAGFFICIRLPGSFLAKPAFSPLCFEMLYRRAFCRMNYFHFSSCRRCVIRHPVRGCHAGKTGFRLNTLPE